MFQPDPLENLLYEEMIQMAHPSKLLLARMIKSAFTPPSGGPMPMDPMAMMGGMGGMGGSPGGAPGGPMPMDPMSMMGGMGGAPGGDSGGLPPLPPPPPELAEISADTAGSAGGSAGNTTASLQAAVAILKEGLKQLERAVNEISSGPAPQEAPKTASYYYSNYPSTLLRILREL